MDCMREKGEIVLQYKTIVYECTPRHAFQQRIYGTGQWTLDTVQAFTSNLQKCDNFFEK